MSLGVWDAAGIAVKTLTYAATLGAAGAVFFLFYSGTLMASTDRLRIRRIVLGLSTLSVFAGAAQIMVSAGSMGGEAAGMLDGSLLHMVWQAGAGRASAIRAIGLLIAALLVLSDRPSSLQHVRPLCDLQAGNRCLPLVRGRIQQTAFDAALVRRRHSSRAEFANIHPARIVIGCSDFGGHRYIDHGYRATGSGLTAYNGHPYRQVQ